MRERTLQSVDKQLHAHSSRAIVFVSGTQHIRQVKQQGKLIGRLAKNIARLECAWRDRKSTRLNSSHQIISYAVFCLKKKIHSSVRNAEIFTPKTALKYVGTSRYASWPPEIVTPA